jgi:ABC-type transport system involved in cytochrome c biogenesis permease component
MSRSFGSDGIRLYCDAAVALTIVFATVIAMVAAVIVGSNALNFSVAIIAFVLTGPIPLFACSAADANQRHLSAIDPFRRLSPPVNLDPQLEHHN